MPYYKKAAFTGSDSGTRFKIEKATITEGEEEKNVLRVWIYPEPYCFEETDEELKTSKDFEFSEDGIEAACQYINEQIEERGEKQ